LLIRALTEFLGCSQEIGSSNAIIQRKELSMKLTKSLGMLLLGIWLIATGLIPLLNLSFSGLGIIMAILAIAAGVLIGLGR
jgi:hypothetical protein